MMQLPLPRHSCDLALAMHMLYHVPDLHKALSELRRVVRPDGVLLVSTNGKHDKHELWAFFNTALTVAAGYPVTRTYTPRFALENGTALLQAHFQQIQRYDFTGAIILPEAAPAVAYMNNMRATTEATLPARVIWERVITEFERQVTAHIRREGVFRIGVHRGVFVCGS
jgi:SAM-dependent methyltransferase